MRYPHRKQHVRLSDKQRGMVRWFRKWCRLNQAAIASIFNVTQPTVSNILRSA